MSRKVKNEDVFRNRKNLLGRKCGVFVVKDLTKKNYHLLAKVKDNPHVDRVWTTNCKVFVKTKNQNCQYRSVHFRISMFYHCQVMSLLVVITPLHQRAPKMRSPNRIGEVKVAEAEVLSVGAYRRRGPGSSNRPPPIMVSGRNRCC